VRTRLASLPHLAEDSPRLASSAPHPHRVLVSDWLVVLSPPHRKPINTGTSQHSGGELCTGRRPDHVRILAADSGNWKIRHTAVVQRYLAEISSAKSLETCNRHTDTEVWKGPASYIVIPTDISNVNTQQTDGETGDKPANVVSGEVQPAVEQTVQFSKRQKHC